MRILFGKFKIQFRNYISSNQLLPIRAMGVKYYEKNSVKT